MLFGELYDTIRLLTLLILNGIAALAALQENGEIIKIGGGRYTSYIWNREVDDE